MSLNLYNIATVRPYQEEYDTLCSHAIYNGLSSVTNELDANISLHFVHIGLTIISSVSVDWARSIKQKTIQSPMKLSTDTQYIQS